MKKLCKVTFFILSLLVAIFLISYPIIVSNLIVDEEPVESDVIIVPEGQPNRSEKAAELYFDDYSRSDKIIVSPLTKENYELTPKDADFPEFEVVIVFSGVTQQLTDSGFNNRTDECRVAGWLMQEWENIYNWTEVTPLDDVRLREIQPEIYNEYKNDLSGRFGRRAEHFFTEQARVLKGKETWAKGDIETFGQLMFESSNSTFTNYETGIPEMATIIEVLKESEGVYGARPSGAGFRGSVIGLVDPAYKEEITAAIDAVFPEKHPEYADVYEVNFAKTADGASYVKDLEALKWKV